MMVGGPHPIKRELAKQLSVATTMTELLFVKVNWAQLLEIKTAWWHKLLPLPVGSAR